MKKILLLPILTLLSVSAYAEPVYLNCVITNSQKDVLWKVALDESAGTVSYSIPEHGVDQKLRGIFTADKVVFSTMEISRVDLSFKRTIDLMGDIKVDKGQCQLATVPKRKF